MYFSLRFAISDAGCGGSILYLTCQSPHLSITVITYTGFLIDFCTIVPLLQNICFSINLGFGLSYRTNSVNTNKNFFFTMYDKP